jgi:tRNA (guanine37-N1)-methyltransferase
MNFHVITLFPEMVQAAAQTGLVGQAITSGKIGLSLVNPRSFTSNVHQTVDDRPFGGGDGMIMMAEPMEKAVLAAKAGLAPDANAKVLHLSPRGTCFSDAKARSLVKHSDLILISSRYGGLDQRLINDYVDEEISIGDYVLSGGELAALTLIDAIGRLIPGVLGNQVSAHDESFAGTNAFLEYPQFTRPQAWKNTTVPQILTSGDHLKVEAFKRALSLMVTVQRRPDLLLTHDLKERDISSAEKFLNDMSEADFKACGLGDIIVLRERLQALKKGRK